MIWATDKFQFKLSRSKNISDLSIVCKDGKIVYGHQCILSLHSKFLKELFESTKCILDVEVEMPDFVGVPPLVQMRKSLSDDQTLYLPDFEASQVDSLLSLLYTGTSNTTGPHDIDPNKKLKLLLLYKELRIDSGNGMPRFEKLKKSAPVKPPPQDDLPDSSSTIKVENQTLNINILNNQDVTTTSSTSQPKTANVKAVTSQALTNQAATFPAPITASVQAATSQAVTVQVASSPNASNQTDNVEAATSKAVTVQADFFPDAPNQTANVADATSHAVTVQAATFPGATNQTASQAVVDQGDTKKAAIIQAASNHTMGAYNIQSTVDLAVSDERARAKAAIDCPTGQASVDQASDDVNTTILATVAIDEAAAISQVSVDQDYIEQSAAKDAPIKSENFEAMENVSSNQKSSRKKKPKASFPVILKARKETQATTAPEIPSPSISPNELNPQIDINEANMDMLEEEVKGNPSDEDGTISLRRKSTDRPPKQVVTVEACNEETATKVIRAVSTPEGEDTSLIRKPKPSRTKKGERSNEDTFSNKTSLEESDTEIFSTDGKNRRSKAADKNNANKRATKGRKHSETKVTTSSGDVKSTNEAHEIPKQSVKGKSSAREKRKREKSTDSITEKQGFKKKNLDTGDKEIFTTERNTAINKESNLDSSYESSLVAESCDENMNRGDKERCLTDRIDHPSVDTLDHSSLDTLDHPSNQTTYTKTTDFEDLLVDSDVENVEVEQSYDNDGIYLQDIDQENSQTVAGNIEVDKVEADGKDADSEEIQEIEIDEDASIILSSGSKDKLTKLRKKENKKRKFSTEVKASGKRKADLRGEDQSDIRKEESPFEQEIVELSDSPMRIEDADEDADQYDDLEFYDDQDKDEDYLPHSQSKKSKRTDQVTAKGKQRIKSGNCSTTKDVFVKAKKVRSRLSTRRSSANKENKTRKSEEIEEIDEVVQDEVVEDPTSSITCITCGNSFSYLKNLGKHVCRKSSNRKSSSETGFQADKQRRKSTHVSSDEEKNVAKDDTGFLADKQRRKSTTHALSDEDKSVTKDNTDFLADKQRRKSTHVSSDEEKNVAKDNPDFLADKQRRKSTTHASSDEEKNVAKDNHDFLADKQRRKSTTHAFSDEDKVVAKDNPGFLADKQRRKSASSDKDKYNTGADHSKDMVNTDNKSTNDDNVKEVDRSDDTIVLDDEVETVKPDKSNQIHGQSDKICPLRHCEFKFKFGEKLNITPWDVVNHLIKHLRDEPNYYQNYKRTHGPKSCEICDYQMNSISRYLAHSALVHQQFNQFTQQINQTEELLQKNLKSYLIQVKQENTNSQFVCFCLETMKNDCSLKKHFQKKHLEGFSAYHEETVKNKPTKFKCSLDCKFKSENAKTVQSHIGERHAKFLDDLIKKTCNLKTNAEEKIANVSETTALATIEEVEKKQDSVECGLADGVRTTVNELLRDEDRTEADYADRAKVHISNLEELKEDESNSSFPMTANDCTVEETKTVAKDATDQPTDYGARVIVHDINIKSDDEQMLLEEEKRSSIAAMQLADNSSTNDTDDEVVILDDVDDDNTVDDQHDNFNDILGTINQKIDKDQSQDDDFDTNIEAMITDNKDAVGDPAKVSTPDNNKNESIGLAWRCKSCDYLYKDNIYLKNHILENHLRDYMRIPRLIAGEKKFECGEEQCNETFKREKHLAEHLITKHKKITANLISEQDSWKQSGLLNRELFCIQFDPNEKESIEIDIGIVPIDQINQMFQSARGPFPREVLEQEPEKNEVRSKLKKRSSHNQMVKAYAVAAQALATLSAAKASPTESPDVQEIELPPKASTSKIQSSPEVVSRKVSHAGLPQILSKHVNKETDAMSTETAAVLSLDLTAKIQTVSSEESTGLPAVDSKPVFINIKKEASVLPDVSTRMSTVSPDDSSITDPKIPLIKIKKEKTNFSQLSASPGVSGVDKTKRLHKIKKEKVPYYENTSAGPDLDKEDGEVMSDCEEEKCLFCDKRFESAKENNAHVLKEHFMELTNLWTDFIHTESITCLLCKTGNPHDSIMHVKLHIYNQHLTELKRKIWQVMKKRWNIRGVHIEFSYLKEKLINSGEKSLLVQDYFKCPHQRSGCTADFESKVEMANHSRLCKLRPKQKFECKDHGKSFYYNDDYQDHLVNKHRPRCKPCRLEFKSHEEAKEHSIEKHGPC